MRPAAPASYSSTPALDQGAHTGTHYQPGEDLAWLARACGHHEPSRRSKVAARTDTTLRPDVMGTLRIQQRWYRLGSRSQASGRQKCERKQTNSWGVSCARC